jgi:hypothetical protein
MWSIGDFTRAEGRGIFPKRTRLPFLAALVRISPAGVVKAFNTGKPKPYAKANWPLCRCRGLPPPCRSGLWQGGGQSPRLRIHEIHSVLVPQGRRGAGQKG